jgi:hypothetical protein
VTVSDLAAFVPFALNTGLEPTGFAVTAQV